MSATKTPKVLFLLLILALAGAVAISGCGGGDSSSSPDAEEAAEEENEEGTSGGGEEKSEKEARSGAGSLAEEGAEVFTANCGSCHTLKAGEGPRAGPTLAGIFGRRIATLPDYDFSPALKKLDIVWTRETLSKLFEVGPAAYTPGTKMPEQRMGTEDRAALVKFLERVTGP